MICQHPHIGGFCKYPEPGGYSGTDEIPGNFRRNSKKILKIAEKIFKKCKKTEFFQSLGTLNFGRKIGKIAEITRKKSLKLVFLYVLNVFLVITHS